MGEILRQTWQDLIGRMHGPFTFRLILQPLSAAILAVRSGLRDARTGRSPYGWAVVFNSKDRHDLLREGWRELAKVFIVAILIDLVYEVIVFRKIYPGQTLIVASVLALLPYPLIRGSFNRIMQFRQRIRERHQAAIASKEGVTHGSQTKDQGGEGAKW
jgi:hypothetical protein